MSDSKHVGAQFNEREQEYILEPFEETFEELLGSEYNRSQQIKIAMAMWETAAPRVHKAGYDITDRFDVRGMTQQAIKDHVRSNWPEGEI